MSVRFLAVLTAFALTALSARYPFSGRDDAAPREDSLLVGRVTKVGDVDTINAQLSSGPIAVRA